MTRILFQLALVGLIILSYLLSRKRENPRFRWAISSIPLLSGLIAYLAIFLFTKDMPADACDGGAILGILLSFILIGMGLVLSIINIIYSLVKKYQER